MHVVYVYYIHHIMAVRCWSGAVTPCVMERRCVPSLEMTVFPSCPSYTSYGVDALWVAVSCIEQLRREEEGHMVILYDTECYPRVP